MCCSMLQYVAVCCSMLQRVAASCSVLLFQNENHLIRCSVCCSVCCSVLQCVAVCYYFRTLIISFVALRIAACQSVLQHVAVWSSVLPFQNEDHFIRRTTLCIAVWCSLLQRGVVC